MRRALAFHRLKRCGGKLPLFGLLSLVLLEGSEGPRERTAAESSYALDATAETRMGRLSQSRLSRISKKSGFRLLANGLDAFIVAIGVKAANLTFQEIYEITVRPRWHYSCQIESVADNGCDGAKC
jgi:hypothetical protein